MGRRGDDICLDSRVPLRLRCLCSLFVVAFLFGVWGGGLLMVVLGLTAVRSRVHVSTFLVANCTTISTSVTEWSDCNGFTSHCVKAFVVFTDRDGDVHDNVLLHRDIDSLSLECSFHPCKTGSPDVTRDEISVFLSSVAAMFPCHYDPDHTQDVILHSDPAVLHYVLWPFLAFSLGLVTCAAVWGHFSEAVSLHRHYRPAATVTPLGKVDTSGHAAVESDRESRAGD